MNKAVPLLFSFFLTTATNVAHWGGFERLRAVAAASQVALQVPTDDTIPEEARKEVGPDPKEAVSSPKEDQSEPTRREKAPQIKDFVPSEKIPADQAVDFPADI